MKTVILISGKLQSGKNAFAEMLEMGLRFKGKSVTQDMFAHDLKRMCAEIFKPLGDILKQIKDGIGDDCLETTKWLPMFSENWHDLDLSYDNFFEDKTPISRALLQIFGTDIVRKMLSDRYWIDKIEERVSKDTSDFTIITDLRFENEATAFSGMDCKVIKVRVNRDMDRKALENEHSSEKDLDEYTGFDYIVDNNGTLDDLSGNVEAFIEDILE